MIVENGFDKYTEIFKKVSNIVKKIDTELMCNNKSLEAEKKFNTKESFPCFYEKIILVDSVIERIKTIILKCFQKNIFYLSKTYFDGSEKFQQIKVNV